MDGIHDMGGMHGFGRVAVEPDEPVFHEAWHGRIYVMSHFLRAAGLTNVDQFRHAIERLDPAIYLTAGYYGRWVAALETLLAEVGTVGAGTTLEGVVRTIEAPPRFAVGQEVRARNMHPAGHTRLPRYVRGHRGAVARVHPACIFPDTHAHGLGENPQYVYSVRFTAAELWGEDAEPGSFAHLDLFEPYLEAL